MRFLENEGVPLRGGASFFAEAVSVRNGSVLSQLHLSITFTDTISAEKDLTAIVLQCMEGSGGDAVGTGVDKGIFRVNRYWFFQER